MMFVSDLHIIKCLQIITIKQTMWQATCIYKNDNSKEHEKKCQDWTQTPHSKVQALFTTSACLHSFTSDPSGSRENG
jgi:hypothetical protein